MKRSNPFLPNNVEPVKALNYLPIMSLLFQDTLAAEWLSNDLHLHAAQNLINQFKCYL